jgi:hypothetical protein
VVAPVGAVGSQAPAPGPPHARRRALSFGGKEAGSRPRIAPARLRLRCRCRCAKAGASSSQPQGSAAASAETAPAWSKWTPSAAKSATAWRREVAQPAVPATITSFVATPRTPSARTPGRVASQELSQA